MSATPDRPTRGLHAVNAALLLLAGSLLVAGACNFGPGAPLVDADTIWLDTVQRGDLLIERRGAGQLVEGDGDELYVQIRVPESQSLDLEIGQPAVVNLRFAEVPARVAELGDRIVQGTRVVRLDFTEEVPEQALPGMSIDAHIEVETVPDVLFVGKPAYGRADSRLGLFRLIDDGRYAERVQVRTGRSSVNMIEIVEGLEEDDRIILSDMSRFDTAGRVALR